jgi:hypothetical protein
MPPATPPATGKFLAAGWRAYVIEIVRQASGMIEPVRRWFFLLASMNACHSTGSGPAPITFTIEPTDELDLLFMIDNSASETGLQEFPHALPAFFTALAAAPGGTPALHAGVITSDLGAGMIPLPSGGCPIVGGDRGVLHEPPSAQEPRFLSSARGTPGDLATALAARMNVGLRGCGYEHQLGAIARALDPSATPENAGFLRPEAHLAIVFLTDEDDCSAPPDTTLFASAPADQCSGAVCALAGDACNGAPPPATDFETPMANCHPSDAGALLSLRALIDGVRASKADPDRQLSVEGVYGLPAAHPDVPFRFKRYAQDQCLDYQSVCQATRGGAALGLRLAAFVAAFGWGGHSHDLCIDDYDRLLADIGQNLVHRLTSACAPALVSSCEVTAGGPLEACRDGGPRPCWKLEDDAGCVSRMALAIDGAGALAAGTRVSASCTPVSD